VLLRQVEAEAAVPSANPKLLTRGLKWCASHLPALHALLLPPPRPRVTYGDDSGGAHADAWARRLGARRYMVVELLELLVNAKRPPLTSALAEGRPPVLHAAIRLLGLHPTSGLLGAAVLRLVRACLATTPLRMALLAPGHADAPDTAPSLPAMIAAALVPPPAAAAAMPAPASRPLWIHMAFALDKAAATDKQMRAALQVDAHWATIAPSLTPWRERLLPEAPSTLWACGPPPARAAAQGMNTEMGQLLRLLQSMPTPSS